MKKSFLTLLLTFLAQTAFPCLIFVFVDKDQHIIVGNHEDWKGRDARVNFIPSTEQKYGLIAFDFASEGLIQGGANSEGLFFDATATPFSPTDFSNKPVYQGKNFWLNLLQTCKNVTEAVQLIEHYKIPELEKTHLLFADKSGNWVIVGSYDGKLTFNWRKGNHQVLSNFNITDPEYGGEQPCPRYATANEILIHTEQPVVETARQILQKTHQGQLSIYSNIYDLTTGDVIIYRLANFDKSVKFNLFRELQKDKHSYLLSQLF